MKFSFLYYYKLWEQRRRYRKWERAGKPMPPPHFTKQLALKTFASRFRLGVLVETGTYQGDMVRALAGVFDRIYSIELDAGLCRQAQTRFRRQRHIRILHGDSARQLPAILAELRQPALFWLDAHYTGAHAGKGDTNTPIMKELADIFAHPIKQHVILIDDARLFVGKDDYPTVGELARFVAQ